MNHPRPLSAQARSAAQLDLFAKAALLRPGDEASVGRDARAKFHAHNYAAAIPALQQWIALAPGNGGAWCMLSEALMIYQRADEAEAAAREAVKLQSENSDFLTTHGLALFALDRDTEAEEAFNLAYANDPSNHRAARGCGQALLRKGNFSALKRHIEAISEKLGPMSWMISQYMIALAMLGEHQRLTAMIDYDRHIMTDIIAAPDGFSSLDAFNQALVNELSASDSAHHIISFDVLFDGHRTKGGPQAAIDILGEAGAPASAALMKIVDKQLAAYLEKLGDAPLARARPREVVTVVDAIVSNQQTSLALHTHPSTWVNMVYYAEIPDSINESAAAGCMEFCPPVHRADIPKGCWPSRLITPRPGMIVLFAGYLFHQVHAMAAPGHRTAIVIDLIPSQTSPLICTSIDKWFENPIQE